MKTPYIPHVFDSGALNFVQSHQGWLSVGVASSIAWPQKDILIEYNGYKYFLHGVGLEQEGKTLQQAPGISTPFNRNGVDEAISRLYRFTSIFGFYKGGYVDITNLYSGTFVIRFSAAKDVYTEMFQEGIYGFDCNYMPIIENDSLRKALAFLREGRRLRRVHAAYSFLSFFKVIESQMTGSERKNWVDKTLDLLNNELAINRIKELRDQGINVNKHLFESGRCAVAHANSGEIIIDPDIPVDRQRIAADLCIIEALANHYIRVDAGVPDQMHVYKTRNRLTPLYSLMPTRTVEILKGGGCIQSLEQLGKLNSASISVRLWPHQAVEQFQEMTLLPLNSSEGIIKFAALSSRGTILLAFAMNFIKGRLYTQLDQSGYCKGAQINERDIEDFTRYYHSVIGNAKVELNIKGASEPVDCEITIPINIIPQIPENAVQRALEKYRESIKNQ